MELLKINIFSIGIIFLGILFLFFQNIKINKFIGFYSKESKSSLTLWKLGNFLFGKTCIIFGVVCILINSIIYKIYSNYNHNTILLVIFIESLCLILIRLYVINKLQNKMTKGK